MPSAGPELTCPAAAALHEPEGCACGSAGRRGGAPARITTAREPEPPRQRKRSRELCAPGRGLTISLLLHSGFQKGALPRSIDRSGRPSFRYFMSITVRDVDRSDGLTAATEADSARISALIREAIRMVFRFDLDIATLRFTLEGVPSRIRSNRFPALHSDSPREQLLSPLGSWRSVDTPEPFSIGLRLSEPQFRTIPIPNRFPKFYQNKMVTLKNQKKPMKTNRKVVRAAGLEPARPMAERF